MILFFNDRPAPSVDAQPRVGITSWRIVESTSAEKHILMFLTEGTMRVTSAIVHVDLMDRTATTASGRTYEFLTPPEIAPEKRSALEVNAFRVGLGDAADVSEAIWSDICSYLH